MSLKEDIRGEILQLCPGENAVLTAPFTEKTVCDAILQMKNNKALGPNEFLAEFYHRCWGD